MPVILEVILPMTLKSLVLLEPASHLSIQVFLIISTKLGKLLTRKTLTPVAEIM